MVTVSTAKRALFYSFNQERGEGACSEALNLVSMIAPIKKFEGATLSTDFRRKETSRTSVSGKRL